MSSWDERLKKEAAKRRLTAKSLTPEGSHANRLSAAADNPREVAFFAQWRKEHEGTDRLYELTSRDLTNEDRVMVSTVIQWLGSNVGLSFLSESLKRCGYKIIRDERNV